jgi:hypothetical protein
MMGGLMQGAAAAKCTTRSSKPWSARPTARRSRLFTNGKCPVTLHSSLAISSIYDFQSRPFPAGKNHDLCLDFGAPFQ